MCDNDGFDDDSYAAYAYCQDRAEAAERLTAFLNLRLDELTEIEKALIPLKKREAFKKIGAIADAIKSWPAEYSLDLSEDQVDALLAIAKHWLKILKQAVREGQRDVTTAKMALSKIDALLQTELGKIDGYRRCDQ